MINPSTDPARLAGLPGCCYAAGLEVYSSLLNVKPEFIPFNSFRLQPPIKRPRTRLASQSILNRQSTIFNTLRALYGSFFFSLSPATANCNCICPKPPAALFRAPSEQQALDSPGPLAIQLFAFTLY
jgi:hypothetical protein